MASLKSAAELMRAGRYADAANLCLAALADKPDDIGATAILAAAEDARGNHGEAAHLFRRLTQMQPRTALHWANLGTALRGAGEFDEAMRSYEQAAKLGANTPDFLLNVALLHIDRLEFGRARAVLQQAAVKSPRNAEIRYYQAVCAYAEVRNSEAEAALGAWQTFDGATPDMLAGIGAMLMQLGNIDEAEAVLREALERDPGHGLAGIRMAQLLERTNRLDEAHRRIAGVRLEQSESREAAEDLLMTQARLAERINDLPAAKAKYQELLEAPHSFHQRFNVLFPLARVHDALGEFDEAMARLDEAHASQMVFLQKANARSFDPGRPAFEIAQYHCDAADVARWSREGAPDVPESPVFVLGFPRSGTTLLEQMLDAHPQLCSMDEQPFLQNAIDNIGGPGVRYPESMAGLDPAQCARIRERYWKLAQSKAAREPGQRLVDKNPLNMLRLPAIARLFPNARIILSVRHPCDVLTSNYMQHYRAPEIAAMCRSIPSMAEGYRRIFDFWYAEAETLKPNVLELVYEELVTDFESHARRVAEFLQLPWDDAMLQPGAHALKRGYISAPSYSQVVQPISRRAVDRWRRYERHFQPVLAVLEPYLRRWNYDG